MLDRRWGATHLMLRVSMTGVALAILLSVALETRRRGCTLTSLSASFYTDSRTVFVGGLVALGVALVAYRGGTWTENLLLNLAGALSPVVAFAPTRIARDGPAGARDVACLGERPAYDLGGAEHALMVYLAALLVGVGVTALASRSMSASGTLTPAERRARMVGVGLGVALVVGLVVWRVLDPAFAPHVHFPAAALMFVLLTGVVALRTDRLSAVTARWDLYRDDDLRSGIASRGRARRYAPAYAVLAVVMLAALAFAVADWLVGITPYAVIGVEVVLLVSFLVFWSLQTMQLRGLLDDGTPVSRPPVPDDRRTLA